MGCPQRLHRGQYKYIFAQLDYPYICSGNINLQNNLQCIVLYLFPSEQATDCGELIKKKHDNVINGHVITLDGFNIRAIYQLKIK